MIDVVAITVGTNEIRWLPQCFSTLLAALEPAGGLTARAVYVDNASTDGSVRMVRESFPSVHVIERSVCGEFSDANNLGIRWALDQGARYVFLVNPDTRTPPTLVADLARFMDEWPEYGAVGPLQYAYRESGEPAAADAREPNDWSRMVLDCGEAHVFVHTRRHGPDTAGPRSGRAPGTLEHAYVQGAALFLRSEVLSRVGLLEETYGTYYEEVDLCRRIRWGGWRVALLPGLGIEHAGGGGTSGSAYRRRRMLRNRYYFLATDADWPAVDGLELAARFLWEDVRRRGPAPAPDLSTQLGDVAHAVTWLARQTPRALRVRREHARARADGSGGPLRSRGQRAISASAAKGVEAGVTAPGVGTGRDRA